MIETILSFKEINVQKLLMLGMSKNLYIYLLNNTDQIIIY